MTPVIFRVWKDTNDVIAFFPTIPSDYKGLYCESYMHVGQHSSACRSLLTDVTRLAKPEEYESLLRELVSIGYDDLKVYSRQSPAMREEYKEELDRQKG